MSMALLRMLQTIRTPALDVLVSIITRLGEETVFLVLGLVILWCIDKKWGFRFLAAGLVGSILNQLLKAIFLIPRPWVLDPTFEIVESAREAATGYSFPSGHTQTAVTVYGMIAAWLKNKKVTALCVALIVLVGFSRMYVGVHTPLDVVVAAAMALVLILAFRPLVLGNCGKYFPVMMGIMTLLAVAYLCFVEFYHFPADVDPHNLLSGKKNAYTLMGCMIGLLIVYFVDGKWLHFEVKAVWWAQIIKVVLGLGIVLAVKSGMKGMLDSVFGEAVGRGVRYFLIVIVAGILWPMSFKYFAKLGKKE
jgi:undecaprenyl-diphosphatase